MKITLDIKDSRFSTFLAFIKTLDYVSVPDEGAIPQWQVNEVNERLAYLKEHPEEAIDLDKTIDRIEKKYGL